MKKILFSLMALWGVLLMGLFFGSAGVALAANGAQHGYVDLTVADADGNSGPYLVRNETQIYQWRPIAGTWEVRTMDGSAQKRTKTDNNWGPWTNISGNYPWCMAQPNTKTTQYQWEWDNWSDWTDTGNTDPNAGYSTAVTLVNLPSDEPDSTGDSYRIQYRWVWTTWDWVLVSTDITTYDITLYVNAWGAMESWMSNKQFPAPLGKYSFSISSLSRVTAASWSVTKNGEPFAGGDLLGNLVLEAGNYLFPPEHEGDGPYHGAGFDMNYILGLDSTIKNDSDGGNRVRIIDPPSFTLDTDTEAGSFDEYEVTVTMTIKDRETGTSVTVTATATITIIYE